MTEATHRTVITNGIRMHVAEQGAGPLVLLCHGFPESWYSWRHQVGDLAEVGFHALAPDLRGYGRSERPEAIDQYTLLRVVGDMVGRSSPVMIGVPSSRGSQHCCGPTASAG